MTRSSLSKAQPDINTVAINHGKFSPEYDLLFNSLDCLEDCYLSIVDADGKIVFLSQGFEKIDGFKVSEITGKNVLDVYKLGRENSAHIKAITEKQVLKNITMRYNSATGQPVELIMDILPDFLGYGGHRFLRRQSGHEQNRGPDRHHPPAAKSALWPIPQKIYQRHPILF